MIIYRNISLDNLYFFFSNKKYILYKHFLPIQIHNETSYCLESIIYLENKQRFFYLDIFRIQNSRISREYCKYIHWDFWDYEIREKKFILVTTQRYAISVSEFKRPSLLQRETVFLREKQRNRDLKVNWRQIQTSTDVRGITLYIFQKCINVKDTRTSDTCE